MNLRQFTSVKERRKQLEKETNLLLPNIGASILDEAVASQKNCENMIGFAQIPIGIAGPLKLSDQEKEMYLPLATTEGALVASVSRGCKALTESGGVRVYSEREGASRGPSFLVNSLKENIALGTFLHSHKSDFETITKECSSHLKFNDLITTMLGKRRFVRFSFDTADAMGMNMVTIATEKIAKFISSQTGAIVESLSANFCTDKKPNWQNIILGRGYKVWAECTISSDVLRRVLKTSAGGIHQVLQAKTEGSMISGAIGNNAQAANVIAALYLATGQDLGHVGEGSQVFMTTEIDTTEHEQNLYCSVYLPDCMVGTVGGGTHLPTQKEALSLLGTTGQRLSEIIGAAVLAGELSLLASLSEGTLVRAHKQLGRGEKI